MTRTQVCMDNCGIRTTIEGILLDGKSLKLEIVSDCINIQKLAEQLKEIELSQLMQPIGDSIVYQTVAECLRHPACLVPAAIIRTMEIEAGVALPGESSVSIEKV